MFFEHFFVVLNQKIMTNNDSLKKFKILPHTEEGTEKSHRDIRTNGHSDKRFSRNSFRCV